MKLLNLLVIVMLVCVSAVAQTIQTIAGGGPRSLAALQTGLSQPLGVAADSSGNIYVALAQLNQIWKISSSGTVNVFAGDGSFPFNGDNIAALNATLYQPEGLAFDTAGNLYVADTGHNRVRKISTTGIITTVAGTGVAGSTGDNGTATNALLNSPVAVAVDSANNVYIVDQGNQRIRLVSGGVITTFAGNGTAAFSGDGMAANAASLNHPVGVAVDSQSNVYIADSGNYRLRKVAGGIITTVAGTGVAGSAGNGGPPASAQLSVLSGVTVDTMNNVYVVENFDVRQIPSNFSTITPIAGTGSSGYSGDGGPATSATVQFLAALAVDPAGSFYLADTGNYRLRKITSGQISTFAGNGSLDFNGNGITATNASIQTPNAIALDNAGSLSYTDNGSSSIRKLNLSSGVLSTVAGNGLTGITADGGPVSGPLTNPFPLAYDPSGVLYFAEGNRIRKISGGVYSTVANSSNTGGFAGDGGPATAAQLLFPSGLVFNKNGDLYIADSQNNRIRVINAQTGIISTIAGTGVANSTGDNGVATSATLNYPSGLALDGAGNLFVCELTGNRVRKIVLSSNIITTVAGNGSLSFADNVPATSTGLLAPFSIFADQSSNLFIADQGHSRVRKVTAGTNLITTVAGNGNYDFSGDGGAATAAAVNPLSITVDTSQTLYIADSSGRIRTTGVSACFFTLSAPVVYFNSGSGSGSITVTATNSSCPYNVSSSLPFVNITGGASGTGSGTITFTVNPDASAGRTSTVSVGGTSFQVVQAGTFAQQNVGFVQPSTPVYALDANGSGVFDNGDKYFNFTTQPNAITFVGDWNGDGRTKVGFYFNGFWVLDYNGNGIYDGVGPGGDKFYAFGSSDPSYIPVVGDWNGDGRTKIGYYHNGFWALDVNGNGSFDSGDSFIAIGGNGAGEVPVVGDWNGDKRTKVGYYYQGKWALDYNGNGVFDSGDKYYVNFSYIAGDKPVVGDWSGSGTTKIGVYRGGFWVLDYNGDGVFDNSSDKFYAYGGNSGDIPIVADWNGDGRTKVGVYNTGFWTLDFNGNGTYDGTGAGGDRFVAFYGGSGSQPLIGRW